MAAMEREVAPLVRQWQARWIENEGRKFRLFEKGNASVICGGIGSEPARRATEAAIREIRPECVISVGFAGALDSSRKVGTIFEPRVVINAADSSRIETGIGSGTLLSFGSVADTGQKRRLREAYGAAAVDMEAAAVAHGAAARGVRFGALKVISDAPDFELPPLGKFVTRDGSFRSAAFTFYVGIRPWLWKPTLVLARNSAHASRELCSAMEKYLSNAELPQYVSH